MVINHMIKGKCYHFHYKPSLDKHACKRELMSYNGLTKSEAGDDFKQATFMVIDGSSNKKEISRAIKYSYFKR